MYNRIKRNADARVRIPYITQSIALAIIPFEEVLALSTGSVLRLVNFLTIFCCLIESRHMKIQVGGKRPILPMLAFLLYAAISIIWCFDTTYYLDRLFTYGLYVILIVLLSSLNPNEKEKGSMLNGLFLGGVLASIMVFFSSASMDIGGRETLLIFDRKVDPNILAYSCVISLAVCMYRILIEKKDMVINTLLSGLLVTAIIYCGSRGALVNSVVTVLMITMNINIKQHKFIKRLFAISLIIAVMLFVYFEFILTSEFGSRFTVDNLTGQGDMGTANRDQIWAAALMQFVKRPIFGYGNGASMYAIEAVYRFYGTHNSYLLLLLEFGVVGFFIAFLWQLREYKMCCKNENKIYKILFYSMLIFVFFVEGFSTKIFWGLQVLLITTCCSNAVKSRNRVS